MGPRPIDGRNTSAAAAATVVAAADAVVKATVRARAVIVAMVMFWL